MKWITRSNIKVDRVACPWLIQRFVDPDAEFIFVAENELIDAASRERAISFDAPRISEVKLNHRGERCTFEAILEDYKLDAPGLARLALIVRAADVKGQEQVAPEGIGLRAIARYCCAGHTRRRAASEGVPHLRRVVGIRQAVGVGMRLRRELVLIYTAGFLRSFGVGLLGVVIAVYLYRIGMDATRIGLVLAAGLTGGIFATVLVSARADQVGRRRFLTFLSAVTCIGGIGLALVHSFAWLLLLAFIGMLNGMGTDRSALFALEQAIIPSLVAESSRTWMYSWYNVVLDAGGALGALAGALPLAIHSWASIDVTEAYRWVFVGYAGICALSSGLYSQLSPDVECISQPDTFKSSVSPETRRNIGRLAALFSLDAFGGGFLGDALVSYWFFRRFGMDERSLGVLFFIVHILNAVSHLGAAWLARRIGLVRTMVFTHLPSSLFLIAVPFAPNVTTAIVFFLLRESLVEMDVPTRQSYVAAIVSPSERTFASGVTNLTRNASWAAASSVAGLLMQNVALATPLFAGGSLKITYDLLLYRSFRHLKAPEERESKQTIP